MAQSTALLDQRLQQIAGRQKLTMEFLTPYMQAYRDQMAAFIAAIRGEPTTPDKTPVGSGPDGRVAVAVCRAMLTSSQQRRWVDLAPVTTALGGGR